MDERQYEAEMLKYYQALPLYLKEDHARDRIMEWYRHYGWDGICISFSGGKDSTVLLDLVRKYVKPWDGAPVKAVFSDTGLEYPEIRKFAMSVENVDVVKPKMNFSEVISKYGYPMISKEVAEAIYYARRIRSQVVQVERERESWPRERGRSQASGAFGKQADWKRRELGGGRTSLSRRAQREIEGQSSKDECPG